MKIIALDINGVLDSVDSAIANYTLRDKEKKLKHGDREELELDFVSVGLLKRLCDTTDARILVSSSMRAGREEADFIRIFAYYGWKNFPYAGKTGYADVHLDRQKRGQEIQNWVDEHHVTNYVILDDDSDMLTSQHDRFVHVSNISGFRTKHMCAASRILGYPQDQLEQQAHFIRHNSHGEHPVVYRGNRNDDGAKDEAPN